MKKYRLNQRGKMQLAVIGLTALLLAMTYTGIYATAWLAEAETTAQQVEEAASTETEPVVSAEYEEPVEPNCTGSVEGMIIVACEYYGIDHEIPLAIAKLETGHFTSRAYLEGNNVGGMSVNEVPLEYASLEEGVDAFVKNLTENYFAEGLDTPEEIGQKYCPSQKEHWINVVNQLIGEEQ